MTETTRTRLPLVLWIASAAFIVYGLREIGEPARKAMITTNMPEAIRARGVGLYWGLRGFGVCSAALVGATRIARTLRLPTTG